MQNILLFLLSSMMIYTLWYKLYFVQAFLQYKDPFRNKKPQNNLSFFLIAIKNEAEQLETFLLHLQSIRGFNKNNCFLIDDYSNDEEYQITEDIVQNFEWVKLIRSSAKQGKKNALRDFLLQNPEKDFILLDADCRPISKEWLNQTEYAFRDYDVIIGYGAFFKETCLINKLIRFETAWIAAQYFGYAVRKTPYMAVGRNMAIKGSIYNEIDESIKATKILSGNDDMIIQALHRNTNIALLTDPKTFVFSKAESTYGNYLNQKRRHISTSSYYKPIHKLLLGGIAVSQMLFYPILIIAAFSMDIDVLVIFLILKLLMSWVFYRAIAIRLDEKDIKNLGPLLEILYSIHLIVLALYSFVRRTIQWK